MPSRVNVHTKRVAGAVDRASCLRCERSVGTVFQLPSPDAIYSQDKEKVGKVGRQLMLFVFARGPHAAETR
jgi:hypothetical protein